VPPFRYIVRGANVYSRAPPQSRKSLFSPNSTESERCFCSPSLVPPPPSFLFSRNRDSWASTKGFFSATAGVYPARPEPSLGTRFRLFWLLSFDPVMSLDPRREREEKASGERREPQKSFYDFRAGDPLEDARRLCFFPGSSVSLLGGFYFSKLAQSTPYL